MGPMSQCLLIPEFLAFGSILGSKGFMCLENGELGRPSLGGLFLEPSVSLAFCGLVSSFGGDSVSFKRCGQPVPLSFSADAGRGKKGRGKRVFLSVGLSIEDSEEWLGQTVENGNAEEEVGREEGGEEQRVGFDGWRVLNAAAHLWAGELAAMASRLFLVPLRRLKHHYIISHEKKNLSEIAERIAELRGFWQDKIAEVTRLERFISSAAGGVAETTLCFPMNIDSYQMENRCASEGDYDGRILPLRHLYFLETIPDVFRRTLFFIKGGNRNASGDKGSLPFGTSSNSSSSKRRWTNILLALNVLVFVAQIASKGKLMLWGAKINSLIDKGQIWRLGTSSLLHANIGHLMVNCFSLNSVGPVVEGIGGPSRFLAVYVASAFASSATSYMFCKSPAVGASGAISGLVGSFATFVLRHRALIKDGKQDLFHIARVIALNMAIGILAKGIDNWGHLGGLLGGAAVSWLVGPAWTYEYTRSDGRPVFVDKPPLRRLFKP